MPRGPPVPQLILIMREKRTPVEHKRFPRLHIRGCVLIPDVAVHETRLDAAAVALQRRQQPRDAPLQHEALPVLKLGPVGVFLLVGGEGVRELFAVQGFPRGVPEVGELRRFAVAGGDVEAELARRGHGGLVEVGELGREADGVGRLLADLAEVGEEEVGRGFGAAVLAPGMGFGAEGWGDGVDGFVGFELALAHEAVVFADGDRWVLLVSG